MTVAIVLFVTVVLGIAAILAVDVLACRGDDADPEPGPAPDPARPADVRDDPFVLQCRPLFLVEHHGHARLDCFVCERGGVIAEGTPVSLTVSLPDTTWLALAVESLLQTWADEQQVVAIEFPERRDRVIVSNGESRIRLPLESAAGLSR